MPGISITSSGVTVVSLVGGGVIDLSGRNVRNAGMALCGFLECALSNRPHSFFLAGFAI